MTLVPSAVAEKCLDRGSEVGPVLYKNSNNMFAMSRRATGSLTSGTIVYPSAPRTFCGVLEYVKA